MCPWWNGCRWHSAD
jgi:hypothetical protein